LKRKPTQEPKDVEHLSNHQNAASLSYFCLAGQENQCDTVLLFVFFDSNIISGATGLGLNFEKWENIVLLWGGYGKKTEGSSYSI
jgi:hypothetical protein